MADVAARIEESGRRRFAGIDRGTLAPSLLVLGLAVLMSVVLPSINRDAPYRHPVRRGEVVELAARITLVPTAGWDVAATGAFALLGNDAVMNLYSKAFGASFTFDWGAALAAPINEELAKGAGVLLLLVLAPG